MKMNGKKTHLIKIIIVVLLVSSQCLAETSKISVSVSQLKQGSWVIEYQLHKAVAEIDFYREGDISRKDWQLFNDKLVLHRKSPTQASVKTVDGSLFDYFKIQFNSDFKHLNKDYELNLAFSDGGLALYTGHLVLSVHDQDPVEHLFEFIPLKGNHSIVKGKVSQLAQQWKDDDLQGTYVYFGNTQPLKTKHMVAVLDQALPEWIQEEMMVALPQIYQYFTDQFKAPLNETPMILFSYKTSTGPGTEYSGGALPGLIQLSLKGKDWQNKSKENLAGFLLFIAHEAAHLWNAQMVQLSGDNTESWIHEGGAEAMSLMALLQLGIYQESDVIQAYDKHLNQCINDLKTHAVSEFEKHKNFGIFYSCGAVIALLTQKAIQTKSEDKDLFDLWSDLIKRINAEDLQLTTQQYFKSLLLLTNHNKTIANIITLIEEPQKQPIEFFSQVFNDLGMHIKANHEHPQKEIQSIQTVIKHMMILDCQTYSFENHTSYYTIGKNLKCKSLKSGMKINKIAELEIDNNGHEIYALVQASCKNNKPIQIQTKQQLAIPCDKPMPVINPWLAIEL